MVDIKDIRLFGEKKIRDDRAFRVYSLLYNEYHVVAGFILVEHHLERRWVYVAVFLVDGMALQPSEYDVFRIKDSEIAKALIDYEYSMRNPICKLLPKIDMKFKIETRKYNDKLGEVALIDQTGLKHAFEPYGYIRGKYIDVKEAEAQLRKYAYVVYCSEI